MVKDMFRFLAKRKIEKSEYDIVYHWYEEKREECERLREVIRELSNKPVQVTIVLEQANGLEKTNG
jgi:hypothetical protein